MKIWKLAPITPKGGSQKGWVMIRAKDQTRAREIAARAFGKSKAADMIHSPQWSEVVWHDPNQVTCEYQNDDLSDVEGIVGMD